MSSDDDEVVDLRNIDFDENKVNEVQIEESLIPEENAGREDNEGEGREENKDDDANRQVVKPKRVVRNPQPKLNEETLKGSKGIAALESYFERVQFKGRGHEQEDLNVLMKTYEYWCHRLFPKYPFDSCIQRLETLGTKRAVQTHLKRIRYNLIVEEDKPLAASDDEDNPTDGFVDIENDPFDSLVQVTPSVQQLPPQLTEEQKKRIEENKRKAEKLRREKLKLIRERMDNTLGESSQLPCSSTQETSSSNVVNVLVSYEDSDVTNDPLISRHIPINEASSTDTSNTYINNRTDTFENLSQDINQTNDINNRTDTFENLSQDINQTNETATGITDMLVDSVNNAGNSNSPTNITEVNSNLSQRKRTKKCIIESDSEGEAVVDKGETQQQTVIAENELEETNEYISSVNSDHEQMDFRNTYNHEEVMKKRRKTERIQNTQIEEIDSTNRKYMSNSASEQDKMDVQDAEEFNGCQEGMVDIDANYLNESEREENAVVGTKCTKLTSFEDNINTVDNVSESSSKTSDLTENNVEEVPSKLSKRKRTKKHIIDSDSESENLIVENGIRNTCFSEKVMKESRRKNEQVQNAYIEENRNNIKYIGSDGEHKEMNNRIADETNDTQIMEIEKLNGYQNKIINVETSEANEVEIEGNTAMDRKIR